MEAQAGDCWSCVSCDRAGMVGWCVCVCVCKGRGDAGFQARRGGVSLFW